MWTAISSVLTVLSLVVSVAAIFLAARSVVLVQELRQRCQSLSASAPESLSARVKECEETLEVLANRVKMSRVRNAALHVRRDNGGEPDAKSDPEAWRQWKNAQLRTGEFNQ